MPIFYGSRYMLSNVVVIIPPNDLPRRMTILDRYHFKVEDLTNGWSYQKMRENIDLDLLAYNITNREGLWFLIADVNDILDPFIPITANQQLIIPNKRSFDDVEKTLNRRA